MKIEKVLSINNSEMKLKIFSKVRTKITPTNQNYNQVLNMGFIKINKNRNVLSCFIENCRYKSYKFDDFHRHINDFHQNDKNVFRNFCLICEKFECGISLKGELEHMIEHINGIKEKPEDRIIANSTTNDQYQTISSSLDKTLFIDNHIDNESTKINKIEQKMTKINENNEKMNTIFKIPITKTRTMPKTKVPILKIIGVTSESKINESEKFPSRLDETILVNNENLDETLKIINYNPIEPFKLPVLPPAKKKLKKVISKEVSNKPTARKRIGTSSANRSKVPVKIKVEDMNETIQINNENSAANDDTLIVQETSADLTLAKIDCVSFFMNKIQHKKDKFDKFRPSKSILKLDLDNSARKRRRSTEDETLHLSHSKLNKSEESNNRLFLDSTATDKTEEMSSINRYFNSLKKLTEIGEENELELPESYDDFISQQKFKRPTNQHKNDISSAFHYPDIPISAPKLENVKNLYPWIDENITKTVVKLETLIKTLLSDFCLFSTYKCMHKVCGFYTTNFDDFKKHSTQHDEEKHNYCSFCLKNFKKPSELSDHIEQSHKFDRFQCSECMYRACEKCYVIEHQKRFHMIKFCQIFESPVQKLFENTLKIAQQDALNNRPKFVSAYHCKTPGCKEIFYCKTKFKKHLEGEILKPSLIEFASIICGQLYDLNKKNNSEGVTQCLFCKFGTDGSNILEHMSLNHQSEFAFICKRMMPTFFTGKEKISTHTKIEYIGNQRTDVKSFRDDLENLKSTINYC